MRKRQIGCSRGGIDHVSSDEILNYIKETPVIRDVILSGGDPLLLDDATLEHILAALRQIPHVEIVRIGTRIPVTFPERITTALCNIIKRYHPVYLNTHFNHPVELTQASRNACAMLSDAGIQLGNQTVLLAGVNDNPAVMCELFRKLLTFRVKPYYLHQMDLVKGTAHFRTTITKGLEIMGELRGHTSGLAVPYYVVDLPGGKGKVPLLPGGNIDGSGIYKLMTYTGELVEYRDVVTVPPA
jgi:lysine 2,3-aminomutase